MQTKKLLLTVSGGLEELAENQIRACFGEQLRELKWHRKPSGSQLYFSLHHAHDDTSIAAQTIAEAMRRFDYVEYVFLLLDSFRLTGATCSDDGEQKSPLLLQQIEDVTSQISQSSIDFCKKICEATKGESSLDAGLKGLPGRLLPTPEVLPLTSSSSRLPKTNSEEFLVNTIYTQQNVAQAVIQTISEFSNQHNQNTQCNIKNTLWVDAGSGNGALLDHMPSQNSIGIDTHPASARVHQIDFLELSKVWLNNEFPNHEMLFVVSNPPFALSGRGDYTPIVEFINHSFDVLEADFVAVICPSKFARERVWKSLDMTETACLLGRFILPSNAFYNPCTGVEVNIHSYCLIFGHKSKQGDMNEKTTIEPKSGVYLSAKRDKGLFSHITTVDLTKSVVSGLSKAGMEFIAERNAQYMLNAKLVDPMSLELWWHLNPQLPCSLANSNAMELPNHSLGWISLSVNPPVALAMASRGLNAGKDDCSESRLAINLMSGEGTIELEASRAVGHSFFLISGDKSQTNAQKTVNRIRTLERISRRRLLTDVVVWDAQNLPLRRGIADAIFSDLPFQGSLKKTHQVPITGKAQQPALAEPFGTKFSSLSYPKVLREVSRVLKAKGRAALLSPDPKALRHASSLFHWSQSGYGANINLGGLSAKLFLMERKGACTKDLSMWVPPSTSDISSWILGRVKTVCKKDGDRQLDQIPFVTNVHLYSTFFHKKKESLSHCYRIVFDDMVRNVEAKQVEQLIRKGLEGDLLEKGITLR